MTLVAQRRRDARHSLMYKIVHNLVLIEAIKYVKLQRNLINLQQILANKKYYEMSFFPRTVKDWNSLPKALLAADSLKAFKAGVVSVDHKFSFIRFHSPLHFYFLNLFLEKCLPTKFLFYCKPSPPQLLEADHHVLL